MEMSRQAAQPDNKWEIIFFLLRIVNICVKVTVDIQECLLENRSHMRR